MTSIDVLVKDAAVSPARPALPSNTSDNANGPCPYLTETLPSPPESSKERERPPGILNSTLQAEAAIDETPHPSPASCTASTEDGSGKLRKKVYFSPWTTSTGFMDTESSIKSLPPSRECQSSKSILKPGPPSTPAQEELSPPIDDLTTMLDGNLRQLASADGQTRFDTYSALCSALKAYDELPNGQLTKGKVQTLLNFIKKDITHQYGESMDPSETNGMLQALKVLVIIVWNKRLSGYLTDSYQIFLLDHSTRILEEHKMPKAVVLHYLHLLSTQEFSSRIITTGRAVRLLEALKDLSDHVKGNGVISERLMVYQRILEQARGAFKSRPSCWAAQLLAAMTCSVPDTRKRAINLGHRATVALGSSSTVATSLHDILDALGEQDDVLSSTICKRMVKMMKMVDEARQVPQIWAIVMLLMRGLERKFHEWNCLHEWLKIIQKCFNCSDSEVRVEANRAWNKLVYIARPYEGAKSFLTKMLIKPILVQLERPNNERQSKSTRNSAFSSYCNLLYYALRPSASFSQCDAVWDEYLVPAFKRPFLSSEHNSDRACRILMALFWREKVSPWRESRALDAAPIEPEELPLLDSRWVRSRSRSILEVFELLFRSSCWGPAAYPDTAFIAVAWRHFAKALGESCRKEVISSTETNDAVGHVSKFMTQMCQKGTAEDSVRQFHFICKTMLLELGPLPFIEGAVSKSDGISCFADDSQGKPPIITLLEAAQALPDNGTNDAYLVVVVDLLQLASKARSSPQGRIHFYRQCTQAMLAKGLGRRRSLLIWTAISKMAYSEIATRETIAASESINAEEIAADVEKILQQGVPYQPVECESWSALLKQSLLFAKGSDRIRLSIIDRLVTSLEGQISDGGSLCTAAAVREFLPILQSLFVSASRKAPSRVLKRQRDEVMSQYGRTLSLLDIHLSRIYGLADPGNETALGLLVSLAISALQVRPSEHGLAALTRMQQSLALWLEDGQRLMTTASRAGNFKLTQARKLCLAIIDTLGDLSKEVDLRSFDRLFAAAFRTSHKITINHMVKMWNSAYGTKKSLEYGDMLKDALARLIPYIDIELPGFCDLERHEMSSPPLVCLESPKDERRIPRSDQSFARSKMDQPIAPPGVKPAVDRERSEAIDGVKTKVPMKTIFKARPRHDDSQINFVSIESSPLPGEALESQNLTARQKEVKERQDREAALLFSDLRSSRASKIEACKTGMISSTFAIEEAEQDGDETVLPATPTLPSPKDMTYEQAAQCSPTPRSKQQALRLEEIEVPSSPVSMSTPADGEPHTRRLVEPSCQNECQSTPLHQGLRKIALAEDLLSESSALDDEPGNTGPADTEGSNQNSLAVGECHDTVHLDQAATGSLDEALPDAAKGSESASTEPPEAKVPNIGEIPTIVPATGDTTSAEVMLVDPPERHTIQDAEAARSSLKTRDISHDVVTTETAGQNDGSNDTNTEVSFQTPINAVAPPEEDIHIHSDNDIWSASQLSQDLERAASSVPSSSPRQPSGSSFAIPLKRDQSSAVEQGSKRRKTDSVEPRETSRLSSTTPELHPSQIIYDCIEVDPTPHSQQSSRAASVVSQASGVSHSGKRGRGRPRKMLAPSEMPGPADGRRSLSEASNREDLEAKPKIEVCVHSTGGTREDLRQVSSGPTDSTSALKDNAGRASSSTRVPSWGSTQSTGSPKAKTENKENHAPPQEAMKLLQRTLLSLRKTSMDWSDLRAIDDLVFEIRTEAQNAAQRSRKSGT